MALTHQCSCQQLFPDRAALLEHSKQQNHNGHHRPVWFPTETPYRVVATYATRAAGMYGWMTGAVETYATEAEALEEAQRILATQATSKRCFYVDVDLAVNGATWSKNGKWKRVRRIKPAKPTKTSAVPVIDAALKAFEEGGDDNG